MELDVIQEREKNKSSLKNRITFFFTFFLLAVFAVFVINSVLQINTVTGYIAAQFARPVVEDALELIDADAFEQLAQSLDPSDPYFTETQKKLLAIKQEANCRYLYTMAQEEGTMFRYIIDGSDIPGGEDFSAMGTTEDLSEWDRAAMNVIYTGNGQLGTLDQNEDYGATISAYEPIRKDSGELVGIIACDIDASGIVQWVRTQVLWQLSVVVVLVIVGLIVFFSLIGKVNKSFA